MWCPDSARDCFASAQADLTIGLQVDNRFPTSPTNLRPATLFIREITSTTLVEGAIMGAPAKSTSHVYYSTPQHSHRGKRQ